MRWNSGAYQSGVSLKALRDHINNNIYGTTNYSVNGGGIPQNSSNISLNTLSTSNSTYIRTAIRMYQETFNMYASNNNGSMHIFTWVSTNVASVRQDFGFRTHTQTRNNAGYGTNNFSPPVDSSDWTTMAGSPPAYANHSQILTNLDSAWGTHTLSYSFDGSTYYTVSIPNVTVGYNGGTSYWNNISLNNINYANLTYSRMLIRDFT